MIVANGSQEKTEHPPLGSVDITAERPGESLTVDSGLDAYTIDLEVTKNACLGAWHLIGVAGVRYASIYQNYNGHLRNADGQLLGSVDYEHDLYGFGPTIAIESRRGLFSGLELFANLRASLLFGDARSRLTGIEDQDLITPAFTRHTSDRHDILPIGELQIGCDWKGPSTRFGQLFLRSALEGQLWSGVGNASSEGGDLGFLGLTVGGGITR